MNLTEWLQRLMTNFGAQWVMWLLLGFFVHHLASSILVASIEGNGLLGSIFSGTKFVTREALESERREDSA